MDTRYPTLKSHEMNVGKLSPHPPYCWPHTVRRTLTKLHLLTILFPGVIVTNGILNPTFEHPLATTTVFFPTLITACPPCSSHFPPPCTLRGLFEQTHLLSPSHARLWRKHNGPPEQDSEVQFGETDHRTSSPRRASRRNEIGAGVVHLVSAAFPR